MWSKENVAKAKENALEGAISDISTVFFGHKAFLLEFLSETETLWLGFPFFPAVESWCRRQEWVCDFDG